MEMIVRHEEASPNPKVLSRDQYPFLGRGKIGELDEQTEIVCGGKRTGARLVC